MVSTDSIPRIFIMHFDHLAPRRIRAYMFFPTNQPLIGWKGITVHAISLIKNKNK